MDRLHPIVVHFPIALLTIYSFLELISLFRKVRGNKTIRYIKLFLVIIGSISAQAALFTGDAANEAGYGISGIIEWHERFANISMWLYAISAIGYALQWYLYDGITTRWGQKLIGTKLHFLIQKCVRILSNIGIRILLALAGMIALTVTGALGGAMVYGIQADPMVEIVIKLLHISHP